MKRLAVAVLIGLLGLTRGAEPLPDPAADGWDSEAFAERANATLKILAKRWGAGEPISSGAPCDQLRPGLMMVQSKPDLTPFTVSRTLPATEEKTRLPLGEALAKLRVEFTKGAILRTKFKLFDVSGQTTRQYFSASGPSNDGSLEINATWRVRWNATGDEIQEVWQEAFERTLLKDRQSPLFTDATDAVLPRAADVRRQYLHGTDYWRQRIEVFNRMFKFAYCGLAIGDADGDGLDDLFSCQNGGLPNRLFLQNNDGTLRDATAGSGLGILDATQGALFLDLDNDGDQDLVATTPTAVVFFRNAGAGRFEPALRSRVAKNGYSLAACDFDGNGFLDVYVCRYHADDRDGAQLAVPVPYFDANNGGANYLIRNLGPDLDGGWLRLDDATTEVGLDANNRRFSFAATWSDLDGDGDQDLYVANDFGRNACYENRLVPDGKAQFREVAAGAGLLDGGFGMSVTAGDFDRDGRRDLYVGNMYSAAGSRVTRQPKFRPGEPEALRAEFQKMARGNSLFFGLEGDGLRFEDRSISAGVEMGRWAWGTAAADVNNDGWQDLLVANGYVTGRSADDL